MYEKKWKIPYEKPMIPPALLSAGYPPLLCAVLALRGFCSVEAAREMIESGPESIGDPLQILNMDKAVKRIHQAIRAQEKVAVYGDYDVDGITATCLVTDYLRSKGLSCLSYIPDRNEEGYGLNASAVEQLKHEGVSLIITVDCGITAVNETELARSIGVDLIITDHHECNSGSIPKAVAVVDCKQEGDTYPYPNLAGVGMALKLVCACEGNNEAMICRYADLAAIGTVADVMPLVGENRYLVKRGLKMLCSTPRPGIAAMLKESAIDSEKLSASSIGYSLAPRLNAAGRLGKAATAAELLMSTDAQDAKALAIELCELNKQRQAIERKIWEEAKQIIAADTPQKLPIVLASERWHQGVIGIAASRLAEHYALPAIMICLSDGIGKGSCRSYGGFNLYEALSACSEHLISFGGHALAAGLNIEEKKLDSFRDALGKYYREHQPEAVPEIICDLLINDPRLLSIENVQALDLLEPYGNKNAKPVLCISGAKIESLNAVGREKEHLRMRILLGGSRFECIYFSHTAEELGLQEGKLVDLAFSPQINRFRGHESVQLLVSAARPHDSYELCSMILHGHRDIRYAASRYCPERTDFKLLWRGLHAGFSSGRTVEEILAQRPSYLEDEKYCICLMVLLEAGLLKSSSGQIFGARKNRIDGKADLEATELIRALRDERK